MGLISDIASGRRKDYFPGMSQGRREWNRVFGDKPSSLLQHPGPPVRPGGSFGRSMVAEPAAFKRLIQAMRSMAPGGWSDNRWEQTKQFVGIAYLGIHRLCTQWSQATFEVFEEDDFHPDGKKPVRKGHPGWALVELLKNPNKQDSWGQHMYRLGQQKYLTGTALSWEVPNIDGQPFELYCLPTAIAIPQPAINPDYPDGYYRIQPVYPYGPFSSYPTPATSVGAPVPAQWIVRHQFPHPLLRYEGYSPLTGLSLELDEFRSISKSRWYKMLRTLNPEAVIQFSEMAGAMPLPWEEIERIHAEMQNENQGPENAGRVLVGTPGATIEEWGTHPKDMDYPQAFDQVGSFALAGLGINKPSAGMADSSNYATLWASLKQFHVLTLAPDVQQVGTDYTKHIAPRFAPNLLVEVKCPKIDDQEQLMARLDKAIQGKVIKKGELRKELGLPILNEPWEDEFAGPDEAASAIGMPAVPEAIGQAKEELGREAKDQELKEKEAELKRPKVGAATGALGSREGLKRLIGQRKSKGLYESIREACSNGRH